MAKLTVPKPTITAQVTVLLPSSVVTVMVAVPIDTGVTTPLRTVATAGLLLDHVTVFVPALAGCTVAIRVKVLPIATSAVFWSSVTPVTGVPTTKWQVAVKLPSSVVAVMVVQP